MIRDYKTSKKEHLIDLSWADEPEKEEAVEETETPPVENAPYIDAELWDAGDDAEDEVPSDHTGKLAYLREKTLEAEEEAKSPAYLKRIRERNRDRLRGILMLAVIASALIAAALLYFTNYKYTTYSVDSTIRLGSAGGARLYAFRNGILIVSNDAVTFVRDGSVVWTAAAGVADPIFADEGPYFALSGRDSYEFAIFDETGPLSTVRVSRRIRGLDISNAGVVAVATESSDTAYVSYFDRYGSKIAVEVKTVLDASGYPVNISISPDGQKLLVVYYSISNGIGESRLAVYDFKNGKADRSYIVASYEDFYDTDTYLASCEFIDDRHAIVIGDNELVILSDFLKGNVVRETKKLSDPIRSALYLKDGLVLVSDTKNGAVLRYYNAFGQITESFSCPDAYDAFIANGRSVVFRNGADILYYNASGVLRYEGFMTYEPEDFEFAGGSSLFFNTGQAFEKITLK